MIPISLVRRLLKIRVKLRKSRVIMLAGAVLGLALVFSLLFMYFEEKDFVSAFYWAIITMATIGYGDITPQTFGGRIVAMIAAVAGISTFTALVSILAEYFISSSLRRMMGMQKVKFKGHYVVIGRNGSVLSCVLELKDAINGGQAENKPIVVILPDEEEKKKLPMPGDVEVLIGDPTNIETLKRARVDRASHVILALEDDSRSVFVTLMIKKLSKAKVFVEVLGHESVDLIKQAGADRVITSRTLAGRLLASAIFEPEVVDVIEDITTSSGNYDITILEFPHLTGASYREAFEQMYSKGYFLLGYVSEEIRLMLPLNEIIPEGAKLIVMRQVYGQGDH
ncbi:calcium-gated potassium channel protein [Thermococci archaeon]|nr:MAG: calcium-gated potassium channel protein [Thermococci archaeon]